MATIAVNAIFEQRKRKIGLEKTRDLFCQINLLKEDSSDLAHVCLLDTFDTKDGHFSAMKATQNDDMTLL